MGVYDKFTRRAKQVLCLAQEEARYFNHPYVGTEHILLGLIAEGEGVGARVLEELGILHHKARSAVEFIVGLGEGTPHGGEMELAVGAKKVIEYAIEEANKLNHHYIDTEHLLLGLARLPEGVATGMLDIMSVSLEHVRNHVLRRLPAGSGTATASSAPPAPARARSRRAKKALPAARGMEHLPLPFSERLRGVVGFARQEALALQHDKVDTPHLLLGLLLDAGDQVSALLERHGLTLEQARDAARALIPAVEEGAKLTAPPADVAWRAREAVLYAAYETAIFGEHAISDGHLLLGLVRLEELGECGILRQLGVDPAALRAELMRIMGGAPGEGDAPSPAAGS